MFWRTAGIAAAAGAVAFAQVAVAGETEAGLECFSVEQTREQIARHGLADPMPLLRRAAENRGRPLTARLCRRGEIFIYEISVLRRDGRIERIPINAASGRPHQGPAPGR